MRLSTTEPNNPVGVLKIRQDDKGTQKIVARITTNSKPQDLTGLEVAFNMRTNDGNVVIEKAIIKDAKLGIIEYVVSGFATQKAGRNNAYFSFFIEDYEQFSTKDFSYFVTNSVTSEGIRGCDYIWKFDDLLEFVTDLANQSQVQLNKLISDVHVIQKQIDEMFALIAAQGVLTADEVRKIMINFLNGEDIEVTVNSDFTGKIAGSNDENANNLKWTHKDSLVLPNANGWNAASQAYINMLYKLDNVSFTVTTAPGIVGNIPQALIEFNILRILEQNFHQLFKDATTTAEKVAIAKKTITKFQYKVWAKASGPVGTLCSHSLYNPSSDSWGASTTSSGTIITQRNITSNNASTPAYLTNDGFYRFLTYAEPSNATINSVAAIDYANIDLTVKFNISDFVATKAQHEALKSSYTALKLVVDTHNADTIKHITATERTSWNAKQPAISDTGWVKLNFSSGVSSSDVYIRRIGDEVVVRGWIISPAESYDIGTLAEMFRPGTDERPVVFKDDAGTGRANLHFNKDGKIRINLNTNVGARINLYNIGWTI